MSHPVHGYADIAAIAALLAEPARARVLAALSDGRALPASVLAAEAGVAASTASEHLARLVDGGLLAVERSGRHRYYRLATADVGAALEALAVLAPAKPITSLRESTRAAAIRRARTCYDHLAGRLGVSVTEALLSRGVLTRTDGHLSTERASADPIAAPLPAHPYQFGPSAAPVLAELGVDLAQVRAARRPPLRFCVDWSEQRHHLSGGLGAAILSALHSADWIRPTKTRRTLTLTPPGTQALHNILGIELPA